MRISSSAIKLLLAAVGLFWIQPSLAEPGSKPDNSFVSVRGNSFRIGGQPYRFVGVNMWYGAYLGASQNGNRERLIKELDCLAENGVTNLRILGASEESPGLAAISPVFQKKDGTYNEDLLSGMDFLLAEMAKRNLRAVIYLSNFWEWSGGMGVYVYWETGQYVDLSDPKHVWPAYARATAKFYANEAAVAKYHAYVRHVVERTNSISGIAYAEDPTIMAWQLANEPRPGSADASGEQNLTSYYDWIRSSAALIKQLAPKQLVSTGNEGLIGSIGKEACYLKAHDIGEIDYLTFHMWPKNWGWIDTGNMAGTYANVEEKSLSYIEEHINLANQLGKPIVLEEFGLERDNGELAPDTSTDYRNRFLKLIFGQIERSCQDGGPFVGTNLWSWGGLGRAEHRDFKWRSGDRSFVGDPPQEPQGLNSVFATDATTLEIIDEHAATLRGFEK